MINTNLFIETERDPSVSLVSDLYQMTPVNMPALILGDYLSLGITFQTNASSSNLNRVNTNHITVAIGDDENGLLAYSENFGIGVVHGYTGSISLSTNALSASLSGKEYITSRFIVSVNDLSDSNNDKTYVFTPVTIYNSVVDYLSRPSDTPNYYTVSESNSKFISVEYLGRLTGSTTAHRGLYKLNPTNTIGFAFDADYPTGAIPFAKNSASISMSGDFSYSPAEGLSVNNIFVSGLNATYATINNLTAPTFTASLAKTASVAYRTGEVLPTSLYPMNVMTHVDGDNTIYQTTGVKVDWRGNLTASNILATKVNATASVAISSSYALSASWSPTNNMVEGATYRITSSVSISSSMSKTASYIEGGNVAGYVSSASYLIGAGQIPGVSNTINVGGNINVDGNAILSGSLWSSTNGSSSIGLSGFRFKDAYINNVYGTASIATNLSQTAYPISVTYASSSKWSVSSSFASSSVSSSRSNISDITYGVPAYPASIIGKMNVLTHVDGDTSILETQNVQVDTSGNVFATNFVGTASIANTAIDLAKTAYDISVTYSSRSFWATSASYASGSTSASYSLSASWAPNMGSSGGSGLYASRSFWATSASYASMSLSASWSPYQLNTVSASYASSSTSASIAQNLGQTAYNISVTYASRSFWATSASYASGSTSSSYATTAAYATNAGTATNVTNPNPGTGTDNYIPKWNSNQLTATSLIYDNGSAVGINTTVPAYPLDVNGVVNVRNDIQGWSGFIAAHDTPGFTRSDLYAADLGLIAAVPSVLRDVFKFTPPNLAEYSSSAGLTVDTVNKDLFMGGPIGNTTIITGSAIWYRFTWNQGQTPYCFFHTLYSYCSTNGNHIKFMIEAQSASVWTQIASSSFVNNWPGHAEFRYYWNNGTYISASTYPIRVTLIPQWDTTNKVNGISLYNVRYMTSYPHYAGLSEYTYDNQRNVSFAANVTASRFKGDLVGTASWATDLVKTAYPISVTYASRSMWATSASYASSSISSSFAGNSIVSLTSNYASRSMWATSASYASSSTSASYAVSATNAISASNADTLDGVHAYTFTLRADPFSGSSVITADTRGDNYLPYQRDRGLYVDFKANATDGLNDGGTFHGALHFRPYGTTTDMTGGPPHQLAFTFNDNLYLRTGINTSNVWGDWHKIVREGSTTAYNITSSWATSVANSNPGTGTNNYVPKWNNNQLTATTLLIDTGTAVGIGITNPQTKLHIDELVGTAINQQLVISNNQAPYHLGQIFSLTGSSYLTDNSAFGIFGGSNTYLWNDVTMNKACGVVMGTNVPAFNLRWTDSHLNSATGYTRLTVLKSGNVGIGTTNPATTLHVWGSSDTPGNMVRIGAWGSIRNPATGVGALSFDYYNGASWNQGMVLSTSGYVGVGTTVPNAKLTINGDANTNDYAVLIYNHNTTAQSYTAIGSYWAYNNQNVKSEIRFGNHDAWGSTSFLAFATTTNSTAVEAMRIDPNGNVGIGTTNPATNKLYVSGSAGGTIDLKVAGRISTGLAGIGGVWVDGGVSQFVGSYTSTIMGFYNDGWNLTVDYTGQVGIGTAFPQSNLTIHGRSVFGQNTGPDRLYASMSFANANYRIASVAAVQTTGSYGDAGALAFYSSYGQLFERMRIAPLGDVGIGTTNPGATLDINNASGTSANSTLLIQKSGTTYVHVRGDGYVGIGAFASANGKLSITSPDTNTAHLNLTNGITNGNASNAYSFKGWLGIYLNNPSFNGGNPGVYYQPIYQ